MSTMQGFDPERLARIDHWMARQREMGRLSGSSVLIGRDGEVAYQAYDGLASIERGLAYGPDTIVRIFSMTKMVTSMVFGMLMERGVVGLDMPVSEFIPEFSQCTALIPGAVRVDQVESSVAPTLHQLLTHTSGLTYSFNPGILGPIYEAEQVDFAAFSGGLTETCVRLAKLPLVFQPGRKWEYSVGIDVIGRVIEVVTGRSLDRVVQEWVLDPLGMGDTHFALPASKVDRFADCHSWTGDDPLALFETAGESRFLEGRVDTFSGGGGLVSTLGDYYRFGEMIRQGGGRLDGERLLGSRTLDFMRRNHLPGDIASMGAESFAEMPMSGLGFGLGGAVLLDPARARLPGSVGDFAWGGMASTYFWTDPVERLSCVYFTQLVPSSTYALRSELKALVLGALVD